MCGESVTPTSSRRLLISAVVLVGADGVPPRPDLFCLTPPTPLDRHQYRRALYLLVRYCSFSRRRRSAGTVASSMGGGMSSTAGGLKDHTDSPIAYDRIGLRLHGGLGRMLSSPSLGILLELLDEMHQPPAAIVPHPEPDLYRCSVSLYYAHTAMRRMLETQQSDRLECYFCRFGFGPVFRRQQLCLTSCDPVRF